MSYRPMVYVQGEWTGNGLRFATHDEAYASADQLMGRWILVEKIRVDESVEPVNCQVVDGQQLHIVTPKEQ